MNDPDILKGFLKTIGIPFRSYHDLKHEVYTELMKGEIEKFKKEETNLKRIIDNLNK